MSAKETFGLQFVQDKVINDRVVDFHNHMGFEFTKAAVGYLEGECQLKPFHGNGITKYVHGGVYAAFVDAANFCFLTTLSEDDFTGKLPFTSNLNISYRNSAELGGSPIKIKAELVDKKKSSGLLDIKVTQDDILITQASATVVLSKS